MVLPPGLSIGSLAGPWILLSTHQRRGLAGLLAGSVLVLPMSSPVGSRVLHEWLVHGPTSWLVAPVSALGESRVGCPMPDLQ
jgi:hypothetical protein